MTTTAAADGTSQRSAGLDLKTLTMSYLPLSAAHLAPDGL
jgi:hypothetical protein